MLAPRLLLLALFACGRGEPSKQPAIRFLHTFGPEETELVNEILEERGLTVESSLVPFARGQQVISEILAAGKDCPDAIRIDATWLPALQHGKLLAPVPDALAKLDWLPEAAALATVDGVAYAVPQAVDGLVVVRDASRPPPSSPSIEDLLAAARATKTPSNPYPLGVRVDGYWFVPWLRTHGGELASRGIAGDDAIRALEKFAGLFGDVASPPPPAGSEAPDELRRWRMGALAYWITGPWQLGSLEDRDRLAITPLTRAPRGGQLLVVPACAKRPDAGWKLAAELTDVAAGTRLSRAFGTVPTRRATLEAAPPLARSVYEALRTAEPLPRDPITPLLFDDLNPALAAVVFHDATAAEAIEGVRRGWQRLPASASVTAPAPTPTTPAPAPTTPTAPAPTPAPTTPAPTTPAPTTPAPTTAAPTTPAPTTPAPTTPAPTTPAPTTPAPATPAPTTPAPTTPAPTTPAPTTPAPTTPAPTTPAPTTPGLAPTTPTPAPAQEPAP